MPTISQQKKDQFQRRVQNRVISEDTFNDYWRWIERFERWMDAERIDEPSLAVLEDFDHYLDDSTESAYVWRSKGGPSPPRSYSYSTRIKAISAVKLWIRREYNVRIDEEPNDICIGDEGTFDPTYLSKSEVRETIEAAPEACSCNGCKEALVVSYEAVMRASEVAKARVDDLDFSSNELYVRASKGSVNRDISLPEETMEMLSTYLQDRESNSEYLFTNTYGDPWTKNSWAVHLREYHNDAGSHSWGRHTPIIHMLQDGVDFGDVYRRTRHKNPQTLTRYARKVGRGVPDWSGE